MDWSPVILSFYLAFITTLILLVVGIPLAWWLSFTRSHLKPVIEALVSMPLVLPPTVLGFYLLIVFSPSSLIGKFLNDTFGLQLVFSFEGLIIGSIIYSLPFMVHPVQSGLNNLPPSMSEASLIHGKSGFTTLMKVLLPNIKPALITGMVLAFAHTVGEFGVVLMIGGNIPGKTKVASIAIYDQVESLNYGLANRYSMILFLITFFILLAVYLVNGGYFKKFRI
jgi:molybdate transport system permease protein